MSTLAMISFYAPLFARLDGLSVWQYIPPVIFLCTCVVSYLFLLAATVRTTGADVVKHLSYYLVLNRVCIL